MKKDILKGFTQEVIELNDDYEGKACAVLVSRKAKTTTARAVLYIHGFSDYFFNSQLADAYNKAGYDFYSLDLRKYGRAMMDHQHKNHCKDLLEYFEEIDKAVSLIRDRDKHRILVLNGHSTGGLISSLYTHERRDKNTINALILNSPWFDMNEDPFTKHIVIKAVYGIGKIFPYSVAPKGLDPNYVYSLHMDHAVEEKKKYGVYEKGLWDFNFHWKGGEGFPVYNSFMRAVRIAHKKVQEGLQIQCPILLLCSDKKGKRVKKMAPHYFNSDCVLDPAHMKKYIGKIGKKHKTVVIENGMHDLALSHEPVRDQFFTEVTGWLKDTL